MINKKIIQFSKLIFIIILMICFYDNKNNNNIFKDTYQDNQIKITKTVAYLNLPEKKDLIKIILNDLLSNAFNKNDYDLFFKFYKEITGKSLTQEEFKNSASNNKNDIVKTFIENKEVFLTKIIEEYSSDDNILKNNNKLQALFLGENKTINTTDEEDFLLPIIKQKERQINVKNKIENTYKDDLTENQINKKYNSVMKYIDKQDRDEQEKIIEQLDFDIMKGLTHGNVQPLEKYITEKINAQKNYAIENKVTTIEEKTIEHIIKTMTKLESDMEELKKADRNKVEQLKSLEIEMKKKEQSKNIKDDNNTDLNSNKITNLMYRMDQLEKKNKQYFYVIIVLSAFSLTTIYKYFFSSDEN